MKIKINHPTSTVTKSPCKVVYSGRYIPISDILAINSAMHIITELEKKFATERSGFALVSFSQSTAAVAVAVRIFDSFDRSTLAIVARAFAESSVGKEQFGEMLSRSRILRLETCIKQDQPEGLVSWPLEQVSEGEKNKLTAVLFDADQER